MSWGRSRFIVKRVAAWAGAGAFFCLTVWAKPVETVATPPPSPVTTAQPPPVVYPSITPDISMSARSISELRHYETPTGSPRLPTPNPWFTLDPYQGTITRLQFEQKLHALYDPFSVFPAYYTITDSQVKIYPSAKERREPQFVLQFAPPNHPRPPMRWFRTPEEFRAESHPVDKPLSGLRVAIDPGHIGGPWAQIEERSTRYHGSAPVQEGDLNLITARLLKQELTNLGATVFLVRDSTEPVTPYRPEDMIPLARALLVAHSSHATNLRAVPQEKLNLLFGQRLMELAEFLFYRCSEIVERGNRIRNNFAPDITVTLYLDATPGSGRGRLTSANENIFFVHGCYTKSEMADPEMQMRCVYKMLEGSSDIETEVAADIAGVFKQVTGLGPVKYGNSNTTRQIVLNNPYVVARNLAANREYDGPVVCTEPYYMNNRTVYQRLLAGDYDGVRSFDGKSYGSIFREYADCVAKGLVKAYASPPVVAGAATNQTVTGQTK